MFFVKEGILFVLIPIILGIPFLVFGRSILLYIPGFLLILLGLFCSYFFRDPKRNIPKDNQLVLAPGDGRVMEVVEDNNSKIIRIFLSVFNVHLQRAPVQGTVTSVEYKPGKFLPAMKKQAHSVNEQNIIKIKNHNGEYEVRQIAGILARRVVSWVKMNDEISMGQKIGLIRFGSQVDLHIPLNCEVKIKPGDMVVAGETVVAETK